MKIIDILNDLSKGKTYKFKYDDDIYKYNKSKKMYEGVFLNLDAYHLELILTDEVEVIEENKEIEELGEYFDSTAELNDRALAIENRIKINELVREVNKLNKEREEK